MARCVNSGTWEVPILITGRPIIASGRRDFDTFARRPASAVFRRPSYTAYALDSRGIPPNRRSGSGGAADPLKTGAGPAYMMSWEPFMNRPRKGVGTRPIGVPKAALGDIARRRRSEVSAGRGGPLYRMPSADSIMEDGNSIGAILHRLCSHRCSCPRMRFYQKRGYMMWTPYVWEVPKWYRDSAREAAVYQYEIRDFEEGRRSYSPFSPCDWIEYSRRVERQRRFRERHRVFARIDEIRRHVDWVLHGNEL